MRRSSSEAPTEAAGLVASGGAEYFGAFDGDRLCSVAGIASDRQGLARYQNVGTLAEYRRRGLASRLLAEAGAFARSLDGRGPAGHRGRSWTLRPPVSIGPSASPRPRPSSGLSASVPQTEPSVAGS